MARSHTTARQGTPSNHRAAWRRLVARIGADRPRRAHTSNDWSRNLTHAEHCHGTIARRGRRAARSRMGGTVHTWQHPLEEYAGFMWGDGEEGGAL